jgi:perosamine synthetase
MAKNIPMFKMDWETEDIKAIEKVITRGNNWTISGEVNELENAISKYVGVKYGVAFNSGTSALHALMLAYGIRPGDEVIVPSFTFIATANCVLFVGAKPVFADIEDEYYGLDPIDVEQKITKKTKAIIPVHYGGGPCRIKELKRIAKKHNLILIEDACESLGAVYDYKMVGSFGDSAVFSFCQNKIITAGEGGLVTTNNKKLAEKLRQIADHGKVNGEFVSLGYNWRMSNLTASIVLSQFKRIEDIISQRIDNVRYLNKRLYFTEEPITNIRNVFQLYTIRFGTDRDKIQKLLTKNGIGNKVYFEPVHLSPFYKSLGYKEGELPMTEQLSKEVITLPMYASLSRKDMDYISNIICKEIYSN